MIETMDWTLSIFLDQLSKPTIDPYIYTNLFLKSQFICMLHHLTHFSVSSLNLHVAYDYHAFLIDKSFLLVVVPEVSNSFKEKHTGFPVTFAKFSRTP